MSACKAGLQALTCTVERTSPACDLVAQLIWPECAHQQQRGINERVAYWSGLQAQTSRLAAPWGSLVRQQGLTEQSLMAKCPMHFTINAPVSAAPQGSLTERGALKEQHGHEHCRAPKPDRPSGLLHAPCCSAVLQAILCSFSMPSGQRTPFTSLCVRCQQGVMLLHVWLLCRHAASGWSPSPGQNASFNILPQFQHVVVLPQVLHHPLDKYPGGRRAASGAQEYDGSSTSKPQANGALQD